MPQGAGPLISWRPPASRQPSRGPQGLVVLMALLVPVLLIIGVAAVVNRSPREVTGPEVTWPPEVQATRTSEARATRTSEARATRTPEARATRTSETRPPTPEPTISFPQVEVPPLPSWLPSHDWKELPTTSDKVSDKLVAHPINKANYPVGNCPVPPKGFRNREQHTAYYKSMINCLQEVWRPYLTALGIEQKPVSLVAYDSNVATPCGSDNQGATAFYCPANATIYLSQKKYEFDVEAWFHAGRTAIHEHFHHIQNQLGINRYAYAHFDADQMEISRRIELQDICSTARLQLTLNLGVTADDYANLLKYSLGDEQHGTKETINHWTSRGFYMPTLQGCNTWGVASEDVA